MKVGIIGMGNMGSTYAAMIQNNCINGLELTALTRIKERYNSKLNPDTHNTVPIYPSGEAMLQAVEQNKLSLDAVIISTPHLAHEALTVWALKLGLHVLVEKPLGVSVFQANLMIEAACESQKTFACVFQQRTLPLYQRVKELVESGIYGQLKRVNWVMTDWYRPEKYYIENAWHASWKSDGGGVLLNQCPHNLDLLQWICGMPVRLQAFCHNGRFHNIEVEDDATIYMEWENGANGTFITSTGDAPGINRLEISLEDALLICENGMLHIGELKQELGISEKEYRATSTDFFKSIKGTWHTEYFEQETDSYRCILQNFSNVINGTGEEPIADGRDGKYSLLISNAAYLSSWEHRMIELPLTDTSQEQEFEQHFEEHLKRLMNSQ